MKRLVAILTVVTLFLTSVRVSSQASALQYVYYGYVPLSPDIAEWGGRPRFPPGALLEMLAAFDDTNVEVWDLTSRVVLTSTRLNRMENYTYLIRYLTYFKVMSDKPISVSLTGGSGLQGDETAVSGLYPSLEGGFAGKKFVFSAMHASATFRRTTPVYSNCFIAALEDATINLVDSLGSTASLTLKQNEFKFLILTSRVQKQGLGLTYFFDLTSTGRVIVYSTMHTGFNLLPAAGGGFVGKQFVGVATFAVHEGSLPNSFGAFAVFPYEAGAVKVYDKDGKTVAERSFTADDVSQGRYWFNTFSEGKLLFFSSTGRISVMCGGTSNGETIDYMGDDICFAGVRKNGELRFYAPTEAVIFAPKDMDLTVDGKTIRMVKDGFQMLDRGFHTVKATETAIVQIMGQSTGYRDWGDDLILPADVDASYDVPSGLWQFGGGFPYEYIAIAAVVAVIAAFIVRKRFTRHRMRSLTASSPQCEDSF